MSGSVVSGAADGEWAATLRLVAERSAVLRLVRRVLGLLVRLRWWLLPGLGAALGWRDRAVFVPDYALFARSGERLLHGDLAAVYADPQVQAGPWELLVFTPLAALDRWLPGWGQPGPEAGLGVLGAGHTLLAVAGPALLVAAAMAGTRALAARPAPEPGRVPVREPVREPEPVPGLEAVAGALVLLWGIAAQLVQTGHPAQGAVPVCWLAAGLLARRGRTVTAGALVAVAAGWETWGLLAVPVLLLAPRLRQALAGGAVAVTGTALTYLPFLAAGGFGMTRFRWPVLPGTLVTRLGADPATGFGWDWRLAQGAAALAVGTAVALATRRSRHGAWLVPAAAVCARLVLDPTGYGYYWVPVLLLALSGLVLLVAPTPGGRPPGVLPQPLAVVAVVTLCWWTATGWGRTWQGTLAVTLPALVLAAAVIHSRGRRATRTVTGHG